jgi:hypothetical protein
VCVCVKGGIGGWGVGFMFHHSNDPRRIRLLTSALFGPHRWNLGG